MEENRRSTPEGHELKIDQPHVDSLLLSMSLSLPMPDDKTEEISEHLSTNSDSFENDRSYQEIEIANGQNLINVGPLEEVEYISQEKPCALDTTMLSENESSIISLHYLQNIEDQCVRSILEDIFQPDPLKSEKDLPLSSKEESFNIFGNLDLDDKSLSNRHITDLSVDEKNLYATNFGLVLNDSELCKRIKDFEELITIKDNTIAALASELDSMKDSSNVNTGSTLSTTEYKQIQEEWHLKFGEFNNAIIYKNELIQQLTASLDQSVNEIKEMMLQITEFKSTIAELQSRLQATEKGTIVEEQSLIRMDQINEKCDKVKELITSDSINQHFTEEYLTLEKTLEVPQQKLLLDLNRKFNKILEETILKNKKIYEDEIKKLKDNRNTEKEDFESEITRLRTLLDDFKTGSSQLMDLKTDLEDKHTKEMEELRTYFERKCADVEKNYSEEIFSQHSRKMSSSSCSEAELNSDIPFSHPPGPEGDGFHDVQPNLNKKDVINLQNELNSIINKISKCDLDNMNDEDFSNLKTEIGLSNLRNLLKYDIPVSKNKHHKEYDLSKKGREEKPDEIKDLNEEKLRDMKEKYEEEIRWLKNQLEETEKQHISISSAVQEVGSSGEFEINEVIQSYERRLQEQVTLAKLDIISALEMQIQRLASNEADDEEWPTELLRLRDRFTEKYETQIEALHEEHQNEIEKLKEEHHKVLHGSLNRERRRSLREEECSKKGEVDILRERDGLKRQVSSLRNLLGELLKYFTQCEDELNNTLVEELLKNGFDKNSSTEDELNLTPSSPTSSSKTSDSTLNITRVHLTPNFTDLINIIENSSTEDGNSKDISIDLKNELGVCLEKLKQEANAILTLTNNITKQPANENNEPRNSILEEKLNSLNRKLTIEAQAKDELRIELKATQVYVDTLERERSRLDAELESVIAKENILEEELSNARNKIAQFLENGRKEIVSEGYGEEGLQLQSLDDTMKILSDLQERARTLLSQSRASADPALLHLIEELCRVGERIKEESKKDRHDLLQQIEAADKKYKTTQKFLEEQAMEREQERDEAQKRIDSLYSQLKERDKDKVNCQRVTSEVENLEHQLQDRNSALAEAAQKIIEVEAERNEAIEKVLLLREIIRDLEKQSQSKDEVNSNYLETIKKLESLIEQYERLNASPSEGATKDVADIGDLHRHIDHLENELQKLRLQTELGGNEGATKHFRSQLYEIEGLVDRRTKELETLHSAVSPSCSSPSEDVSAREVVFPKSPKKMEECEVPLQQLARLREKLIRHSRAEDAAMKRIRDLEMQAFGLKHELEETTSEREYMKKQIQEQLVLISDFQIRLDEQRIRADNIEKQTNTSLEIKIYDLQNEILTLREKLQQKEKAINNQQLLLADTQERLKNLENDLSSSKEDDLIVSMQKDIEKLRAENSKMKNKIKNDANMVPNLVENIISDKNSDMERLRIKLDDTEKLLEEYTSLKLDKKDLQTLSNLKSNGTSLEELFSILDLSQPEQLRKVEHSSAVLNTPSFFIQRKKKLEDTLEPEISAIAGPGSSNSVIQTRNSTEISHKKVHFEEIDIEELKKEIDDLNQVIEDKDKIIKDYEERLKLLNNLEMKIEKLQSSLEETEKTLTATSETFEKEQRELKEREKDLGVQLAEKKLHLEQKQKEVEVLEQDSRRKDETYKSLAKEKKSLEKEITTLKHENFVNVDKALKMKNQEIDGLKAALSNTDSERDIWKQQLSEKNDEISALLVDIGNLTFALESSHSKMKILEISNNENENEITKLNKDLDNKNTQIENITKEIESLKEQLNQKTIQIEKSTLEITSLKEKLSKKRKIIRDLQDQNDTQKQSLESILHDNKYNTSVIIDKDATIEILNEDADRYQTDISILQSELKELKKSDVAKLKKELQEKETKITELNRERTHLLDLLNEKEKIITQMAEDSHQLHTNLVTIKSKIKEPGNIIDLGNKLKEEQRKTAEFVQEIHNLKAQLLQYKNNDMTSSVDEIADQLRRELDHSIKIDSNILNAVSDQSLNSISETHDVEAYKRALSKEKTNKKQLLQHVHKLQAKITELQNDLEKERACLLQTRTEDARCIEQLRIELDSCLDSEEAIKRALTDKNAENEQLEKELNSLKAKNLSTASKSESTEYKQLPNTDTIFLNQLRRDYDLLLGEKNQLTNELAALKQSQLESESGHKCTRNLLDLEIQRKRNLEDRVQSLSEREKVLKDSLMQKNLEMERVVDEMSQEKADLIKQKLELLQRLKSQNPFLILPPPLQKNVDSDELFNKIKELNNALIDNKKLMDLVTKISDEKKRLEVKLEKLKTTNPVVSSQIATNDLIERTDYLFAKTLRLDSMKKALLFQKRYLMNYLKVHEQNCPNGCINIFPDPVVQRRLFRQNFTLKHRFRAISFVIISIIRMKFMVRRWHSGVRIAERVNARHYRRPLTRSETNLFNPSHSQAGSAHFQVGQPVSHQIFSNFPAASTSNRNLNPFIKNEIIEEQQSVQGNLENDNRSVGGPWSGNTPPSKEKRGRKNSNGVKSEDMNPLKAPQLLAQFVERFDQMQEKLGFALEPNST